MSAGNTNNQLFQYMYRESCIISYYDQQKHNYFYYYFIILRFQRL